jgi:hypothetical protein
MTISIFSGARLIWLVNKAPYLVTIQQVRRQKMGAVAKLTKSGPTVRDIVDLDHHSASPGTCLHRARGRGSVELVDGDEVPAISFADVSINDD